MDISGTYTLSAPREHVWSALQDPDTLRQTIPGCERLERAGDGSYNVRLNVGVAAVKGVYDGKLRLTDLDPPARYRIVVDGKGLRGVLHGDGVLTLDAPDANTTIVSYQGTALLGGALAGVGNRLAGGAASMLIKSYFAKLGETVGAAGVADVASAPAMAAAPTAMPSAPAEPAPPAVAPAPAAAMPAAAMPEPPPAPAPAAPIMSVAPEPLENLAAAMPAPASATPPPAPDVASAPSAASPAREPEPVGASVFAAPSSASSAADAARQRSWWRRLFGR